MTQVTTEQVCVIQQQINIQLENQESEFEKIRMSEKPLVDRWQQFIGVILPVQLQVIQEFGYSGDQSGLSEFNEQLMKLSDSDDALRKLNEAKWSFLLDKAFGLTEHKKIQLEDAKKLIEDIAEVMISEDFLQKVDRVCGHLKEDQSLFERRQKLLQILLPLHMSVMSQHGFNGEVGYVQAQRALMDYYYDPFVSEKANHAQKVVFQRAKLLD